MKRFLFLFLTSLLISALIYQAFSRFKRAAQIGANDLDKIKLVDFEKIDAGIKPMSLKVLSANLIGEFENNTLKNLKILGEIKNNGQEEVSDATPIVVFADSTGVESKSKIAQFADGYFLPNLKPQETYFFAVTVPDPPAAFTSVALEFKPKKTAARSQPFSQILKIADRRLEPNIATSSAGKNVTYFRLRGEMVNTGERAVQNAVVMAYLKDEENLVFSWGRQAYPSDLFRPGQRQEVNILLTPQKEASMSASEVFLFGDEL